MIEDISSAPFFYAWRRYLDAGGQRMQELNEAIAAEESRAGKSGSPQSDELMACACGCGRRIRPGAKYVSGHSRLACGRPSKCVRCGGERWWRSGFRAGMRRWKCKICGKVKTTLNDPQVNLESQPLN